MEIHAATSFTGCVSRMCQRRRGCWSRREEKEKYHRLASCPNQLSHLCCPDKTTCASRLFNQKHSSCVGFNFRPAAARCPTWPTPFICLTSGGVLVRRHSALWLLACDRETLSRPPSGASSFRTFVTSETYFKAHACFVEVLSQRGGGVNGGVSLRRCLFFRPTISVKSDF